ncbi:MAG: hypothetical protein HWE10_08585 [Gammaproteobacteria bacterium]|nr:hypothetical protein [Gammaproteobacteria bacterium]
MNIRCSVLFAIALLTNTAQATDVDHFKGKASPDLKSALCNLQEFDKHLKAATTGKKLSPEQMAKVHKLTYTLEVAVQRVQAELEIVAEELEHAHKGSEVMDNDKVKSGAAAYLARTKLLTSALNCD